MTAARLTRRLSRRREVTILRMPPAFFETLVRDLLHAVGYRTSDEASAVKIKGNL